MIFLVLLFYSIVVTGWVSIKVLWLTERFRYDAMKKTTKTKDFPTVSVCIAARNETHALSENLELVLASDYLKLEILVLDDNSNDDTSVIIKSFAHAGVRFIPGRSLPEGWLGRNHAYHTLSHEASGDIILFLDVDTKLAPHAVATLVEYMEGHRLSMLSVQPRREDLRMSAIFGSLKQAWELLVATKKTPPAASGVWMIRRDVLHKLDDTLADYGMSIRPELHIAHHLQRTKAYRYLIATKELGVRYEKKWHSQKEAAERLYMPLFGKSIVGVLRTLLMFGGLLMPYALLLEGLMVGSWFYILCGFAVSLLAGVMNARIVAITHAPEVAILRAILWPLLLIQDVAFYLLSWLRYRTKTVTWKGRNIVAQPRNHSHYQIDQ